MVASLTITGTKQLERKLKQLEPKVAKKVIRQSLRAGAKIIHTAAKAEAPKRTGVLRKSLKVRAARRNRRGTYAVMVTSGEAGNMFTGKAFYGAFIHWGTKFITSNPFIKRVYAQKEQEARSVVLKSMAEGIEREARKP